MYCKFCKAPTNITVRHNSDDPPFACCKTCKDLKNSGKKGTILFISGAWKEPSKHSKGK